MPDIQSRLATCFLTVFPDVAAADLPRTSQASLPTWDSLTHVTLMAVIEEEFQIKVDEDSMDELISYPIVLDYVQERL